MAVKFFGQFLVEQGVVNRDALLQAVDLQEQTNLKFGEMVVDMKLMTIAEVERVNLAQRSEDLQFGDMAVKLGIITAAQVQQVLTTQRNNHLYIGEALIKVGALSPEQLQKNLQAFKQDQQPYLATTIEIPSGIPHQPMWEMVADLTYKMLTRVAKIPFRPGLCTLVDKLPERPIAAGLSFSGAVNARYLMAVTENIRNQIAKAILDEESVGDEPLEVLDDAVREFINIVCGNVAAKAAQLGFTLEIDPPETYSQGTTGMDIPQDWVGLVFPLHSFAGESFELVVLIANA